MLVFSSGELQRALSTLRTSPSLSVDAYDPGFFRAIKQVTGFGHPGYEPTTDLSLIANDAAIENIDSRIDLATVLLDVYAYQLTDNARKALLQCRDALEAGGLLILDRIERELA